jgi:flagellar motor switch/type III secretory pathway protein FliN
MSANAPPPKRSLAAVAAGKPFSEVPVPVEAVFCETTIPLGKVARLRPGEVLRLEGVDVKEMGLRILGIPAARGLAVAGDRSLSIQITHWNEQE